MFHPIKDETSTLIDTKKPYYLCSPDGTAKDKCTFSVSVSVSLTLHLNPAPMSPRAPKNYGAPAQTVLVLLEVTCEELSSFQSPRKGFSDSDGALLRPHR